MPSHTAAKQDSQQPSRLPIICPIFNCGRTFLEAHSCDMHLAVKHALPSMQGAVPKMPGAVSDPRFPSVPEFDVPKKSPHFPVTPSPAANVPPQDILNCPVRGCSDTFPDIKSLLVHGRDLHRLLDTTGLNALGIFTGPGSTSSVRRASDAPNAPTAKAPAMVNPSPGHSGGFSTPGLAPFHNPPHPAYVSGPPPPNRSPALAQPTALPPNIPTGPSAQNRERLMRCLFPGCNATFTRALEFRQHEKKVHQLPTSAQCAIMFKVHCRSCQKSYWTQEALANHILLKHQTDSTPTPAAPMRTAPPPAAPTANLEGEFRCEICRLGFRSALNLNYHKTKSSYHRSLVAASGPMPHGRGEGVY